MVWITCGLLWCFYQLFGLSFWRHPFTAGDPLVCNWCNAKFIKIWWWNKLIYILDGLRVSAFSPNFHFRVNYSFKQCPYTACQMYILICFISFSHFYIDTVVDIPPGLYDGKPHSVSEVWLRRLCHIWGRQHGHASGIHKYYFRWHHTTNALIKLASKYWGEKKCLVTRVMFITLFFLTVVICFPTYFRAIPLI